MPITSLAGAPFRTKKAITMLVVACKAYQSNQARIDAFFAGDALMLALLAALSAACGELLVTAKTDEG
jgi:hypothetical protein